MNGILLTSPRTALGSVLASLATDGFRHGARNHGYGNFNDYALLLRHNRGAFRVGMKHLPKGNTSSLLCLCGISVSLAFYVLYLKFFPRSYHSVILRRVIRRMIQARSQRQTSSILISTSSSSSRRRQRTLQQTTTSFSVCNESYNNDDNNNNNDNRTIKISDDDTGLSSIGSIDSSKQDGVIFRDFHQTSATIPSSFSSAITPAAASSAAAADQQQRMRHRITRRRRTHSESPPDVISRLDDFICLIPEIVDRSRHVQPPISRTRNVLDWLAQIDFDSSRTSLFDEDPLDDAEDAAARRALMKGMQSLESVASAGSGSSNCGCVYRSRDDWCQDCLLGSGESMAGGGGGRSGRRLDSMEVQLEDPHQGLSVSYPRSTSASSATLGVALRHGRADDCSTDHSSVVPVPALGGAEERGGPEVAKVSDEGHDAAPKKPFFYFEEEEEDEFFESTSKKGDLHQPVHFATSSSSGQMDIPGPHPKQGHLLGPTESPTTDGPPNSPGGSGYDWLRMRILGVDRKRRISTGSGLSAKFLASRGLLRNHHSFTSAISGTSSEYTYRESLVSKGFSIDCGEDLTDFVIQGEDLLEAAEFSRYTLTNIDQLHEELEFIQRNITYINNKVEFLQTRDDLPTFAARYGYGIEESIGNDLCGIMEAAGAFETGMRPRQRSRSLCLMPGDVTTITNAVDNTQVSTTFKDIEEDLHPGVTTDGFVWDYGSDLALNPTFTHHRSLNGLAAGEVDEDNLTNQLRTRRSRSDEMEYFNLRRGDLAASDDDLCAVKFDDDDDDDDDDVIEDDPEVTYYSAQLPVRQHTESTCDEYFDDDYDMLTHLHR